MLNLLKNGVLLKANLECNWMFWKQKEVCTECVRCIERIIDVCNFMHEEGDKTNKKVKYPHLYRKIAIAKQYMHNEWMTEKMRERERVKDRKKRDMSRGWERCLVDLERIIIL